MKIFKFFSITLLITVFSLGVVLAKDKESVVKIKTSAQCNTCKATIEKALSKETGVQSAKLDVDSKIVTVKFNPDKTDITKIKTAITKSGYDADEMSADKKAYDNLHSCCKKK